MLFGLPEAVEAIVGNGGRGIAGGGDGSDVVDELLRRLDVSALMRSNEISFPLFLS